MTPGPTPRFDLYAELEVSRQATPEVIEAAYRALVKRHHPDVADPADQERIARLNVAREWLLSPTRRATYDGTATVDSPRPRPRVRREPRRDETAARPARTSSPESFGVNSREVRQFLAELREIDGVRAASLLVAKGAVDAAAHAEAREASLAVSRASRNDEWGFARDAASVIVRGKLTDSPFARAVADVVADVAGAIVVRDLLPPRQFLLLLEPWTRSKAAPPTDQASGAAPLARPHVTLPRALPRFALPGFALAGVVLPSSLRITDRRRPLVLGILGGALALLIAVALFGGGPGNPGAAVAGLTSDPSSGSAGLVGTPPAPGTIVVVSPSTSGGDSSPLPQPPSTAPTLDPTPVDPGRTIRPIATQTPRSTPAATPRPTAPSAPSPTPPPTPAPTAPPPPTPVPTPSPSQSCTVVDLVGTNSGNAQLAWSGGGFTGTVLFSPQPPPQFKIGSQSLTAGTKVACTSNITVQPAP